MKIVVKEMNINLDNDQLAVAQNEVAVLKTLNHPNICEYYDSFRRGNKFNIIMEYAKHGNLYEYLKRRHATKTYLTHHVSPLYSLNLNIRYFIQF